MTQEILGYKWNNINGAQNACNALRAHYLDGRPSGDYTSTEVQTVSEGICEGSTVYYFAGDYAPVLGNAEVFYIDIEEMPL